jgi:hypothetical protein
MITQMIFLILCFNFLISFSEPLSIYDVLRSHDLPIGLLPKGVKDFTYDDSGRFEVHLEQACNAKFENELHYDQNISGSLSIGQIDGLSGISAQDLFLWFPVKEIRVDIPSSGLIYFDVGVVSKQFSLSSFETPRDCLAAQSPDLRTVNVLAQILSDEGSSGNFRYQLDHKDLRRSIL